MAVTCKICSGEFKESPDSVILCAHKDGIVHMGCCINSCSWDKKPCSNCIASYDKI